MLKPTGMFTLCLPLINWCRILSDHPIFKSFFFSEHISFKAAKFISHMDFSYLTKKCQVQLSSYPPLNSWSLGTTGRSRYIGQIGVGVGPWGVSLIKNIGIPLIPPRFQRIKTGDILVKPSWGRFELIGLVESLCFSMDSTNINQPISKSTGLPKRLQMFTKPMLGFWWWSLVLDRCFRRSPY